MLTIFSTRSGLLCGSTRMSASRNLCTKLRGVKGKLNLCGSLRISAFSAFEGYFNAEGRRDTQRTAEGGDIFLLTRHIHQERYSFIEKEQHDGNL